MAGEIGGGNGVLPVAWAAGMGLPLVDADGMGRAFPEVPQVTMQLAGISPSPAVMTDERGNLIVFQTISGQWMERLERAAAAEFGGAASSTEFSLTAGRGARGDDPGLGVAGHQDRRGGGQRRRASPVAALIEEIGAFRLITGKVSTSSGRPAAASSGAAWSSRASARTRGRLIRLELQNENLVALERGKVLASVPDLITVLDSETADAIATERIRYGQRVTVIAFACAPVWRTERGIAATGPRTFGYDFDYQPVEELAGATT